MTYMPDINELSNLGLVILLLSQVVILLWALYDWSAKDRKDDEMEYYIWFDVKEREKK